MDINKDKSLAQIHCDAYGAIAWAKLREQAKDRIAKGVAAVIAEHEARKPSPWITDRQPINTDGDKHGEVLWITTRGEALTDKWSNEAESCVAWMPIPKFEEPDAFETWWKSTGTNTTNYVKDLAKSAWNAATKEATK